MPSTVEHPSLKFWHAMPTSQKMLSLSLIAMVFILPIGLIFGRVPTENRGQAAVGDHPIDLVTQYVILNAEEFYIEYNGQQYFFDESTVSSVLSSPGINNDYTTIRAKWENQEKPLELYLEFEKTGNTWNVSQLSVDYPMPQEIPSDTFRTTSPNIQGTIGSSYFNSVYDATLTNTYDTQEQIHLHADVLTIQPFLYQLEIPTTTTGYFIEVPPFGNESGIHTVPIGAINYNLRAYLRNVDGTMVTDQSSFTYNWSVNNSNITITESTPNCLYGIQPPCPQTDLFIIAVQSGSSIIHLSVTQNGTIIDEVDIPVNVPEVVLPPLCIDRINSTDFTGYCPPGETFTTSQDTQLSCEVQTCSTQGTIDGNEINWQFDDLKITATDFSMEIDGETFEINPSRVYHSTYLWQEGEVGSPTGPIHRDYTIVWIENGALYRWFISTQQDSSTLQWTLIYSNIERETTPGTGADYTLYFSPFSTEPFTDSVPVNFSTLTLNSLAGETQTGQMNFTNLQVTLGDYVVDPIDPTPTPTNTPSPTPTVTPDLTCLELPVGQRADFEPDGEIDLNDYTTLVNHVMMTGVTHEEGDANCDGKVNLNDYTIFVNEISM